MNFLTSRKYFELAFKLQLMEGLLNSIVLAALKNYLVLFMVKEGRHEED